MNSEQASDSANTPPVTVAVPVYNLERYLPDAISSIQAQDYSGQVTIVILDDGSTDNSLSVAKNLAAADSRIIVHHHENQGRAVTRSKLVELAQTEFLAWLDGDDIAAPNWLSEQIEFLAHNKACAAVSAQGYAMTASAFPIGPIRHPLSAEEIDKAHIEGQANVFFQSCVTVRRSAVQEAGGYDTRYHCAEDYSLWLRLSEIGNLQNLNSYHLYYRVHATSANWTVNVDQRTQGQDILNEARQRRGLPRLSTEQEQIPPARIDDWNRRIYWINIALKSANPLTALQMTTTALRQHPASLLLWLMGLTALCDTCLFRGNKTSGLQSRSTLREGTLPSLSVYRLGKWLVGLRRRLQGRTQQKLSD